MRKIFLLLLSIAVLLSFSSCGETDTKDSTSTTADTNGTSATTAPPTTAANDGLAVDFKEESYLTYGINKEFEPFVEKITSLAQLDEHYKKYKNYVNFSAGGNGIYDNVFSNRAYYNETFFAKSFLIFVVRLEGALEDRAPRAESVYLKNDVLELNIVTDYFTDSAGDMGIAPWHTVIELDKAYADKEIKINHWSNNLVPLDFKSASYVTRGSIPNRPEFFEKITSPAQLDEYYNKYKNNVHFDSADAEGNSMLAKVFQNRDTYNESFFEKHFLLFFVKTESVSSPQNPTVASIYPRGDALELVIDFWDTGDTVLTPWHVVIEVDNAYAEKEIKINLLQLIDADS